MNRGQDAAKASFNEQDSHPQKKNHAVLNVDSVKGERG